MIYRGLTAQTAQHYRQGGLDAYGNSPERAISKGSGTPCRRCLCNVPEGKPYLLVAHRPFAGTGSYAETGPIFLCADACRAQTDLPPVLTTSPSYLIKAYSPDERIIYGTGKIVAQAQVHTHVETLLAQTGTAFVDIRSASNNCWLMRAYAG